MADSPSRPPLQGYNHNIKYGSRVYHVQTEDSGIDHPHLFTHLFFNGVIIATAKTGYGELAVVEGHEPKVRKMMQEQHKRLMKQLRSGQLDDKISAMLGVDEVLAARQGAAAGKAPAETTPKAPAEAPPAAAPAAPAAAGSPPSMAELAAAAGVSSPPDATDAPAAEAAGAQASHPVATWIEPGELQADESSTLRMVVGEQPGNDEEDTLVTGKVGAETRPYAEGDKASVGKPARAVPHAPPAPAARARPPHPDAQVRKQESRPDLAQVRGPTHGRPPTGQRPRAQALPTGATVVRPSRGTGSYDRKGTPDSGRPPIPGGPVGSPRDSGIYQITVGGARPVGGAPPAERPRVIARPAVIVDRAPSASAASIQQALSDAGSQQAARGSQSAAARPSPPGPPGTPHTRTLPSIFGSDLISERSLDEVILQYLSEDQE